MDPQLLDYRGKNTGGVRLFGLRGRLDDLSRDVPRMVLALVVLGASIALSIWYILDLKSRHFGHSGYAHYGWVIFAGHIPMLSAGLNVLKEIAELGTGAGLGRGVKENVIMISVSLMCLMIPLGLWVIGTFGLLVTSKRYLYLKIILFYLITLVVNFFMTVMVAMASAS